MTAQETYVLRQEREHERHKQESKAAANEIFGTNQKTSDTCQFCGKINPRKVLVKVFNSVMYDKTPACCSCEKGRVWHAKFVAENQANAEAKRISDEQHKRREEIRAMLEYSGMGELYYDATFVNYEITDGNRNAHTAAKEYAANFTQNAKGKKNGLMICGDKGTGKGHLTNAIANDLIVRQGLRYPAISRTAISILLEINETFNSYKGASVRELIANFTRVPLLIIQDLGKEKLTESRAEWLYAIIDERVNQMLPIVVTTNHTPDELAVNMIPKEGDITMGETIVDRLVGKCKIVTTFGESYRTK